MFKFATIGAYKSVLNNPRVRAIGTMKNGYVYGITDNYSANGSKSSVAILVASAATHDGVIKFDIGGQSVYTTIVALTQDTAAKVAALIKTNLDAVLLGLNYTVAIDTATITVTAPVNGVSLVPVTLEGISLGESACTLAPTYTAGTDAVTYSEAAVGIATDAAAKAAELWVAMNIIDKPEIWDSSTFSIAAGEYVNSFKLNDLKGLEVEMSSDLCTTAFASVAVGAKLVPVVTADNTNIMKWKVTSATDYGRYLKVVEKTTFGGTGYLCKVI